MTRVNYIFGREMTTDEMSDRYAKWLELNGLDPSFTVGDFLVQSESGDSPLRDDQLMWLTVFADEFNERQEEEDAAHNSPSDPTPIRKSFRDYDDFEGFERLRVALGAEDTSWHSDLCPSMKFRAGARNYCLFVDYLAPERREVSESNRFGLEALHRDGSIIDGGSGLLLDQAEQVVRFRRLMDLVDRPGGE